MLLQARTLGQLTGSVESRYLDTYSGILALEADKATVARLTLRTGGQAGAAEARRPPTRPSVMLPWSSEMLTVSKSPAFVNERIEKFDRCHTCVPSANL